MVWKLMPQKRPPRGGEIFVVAKSQCEAEARPQSLRHDAGVREEPCSFTAAEPQSSMSSETCSVHPLVCLIHAFFYRGGIK